jgi:hypothetical protein
MTIVAHDQELWTLLHGRGPFLADPDRRNDPLPGAYAMDELQRWLFLRDRLLAATRDLPATADVKLVLEVRMP